MALQWKDEYCIGLQELDEQHKNIFEFLNQLEQLIEQGIDAGPEVDNLLNALGTDIQTHFSFEEICMARHRCHVAETNKAAHEMLLAFFRDFQREYNEKGSSVPLLTKFHRTAESWVLSHICEIDLHLRSCVRKRK